MPVTVTRYESKKIVLDSITTEETGIFKERGRKIQENEDGNSSFPNFVDDPITPIRTKINWEQTGALVLVHLLGLYGLRLALQGQFKVPTVIYAFLLGSLSFMGISVGAHRYWTHRSFKAKPPLKLLLITLQTMMPQKSMWDWVSWHRVHHKYVDTDRDPQNARRGFWYSHIGWVALFNNAKFTKNLEVIDMSDLTSDPLVMFQKRYYYLLSGLLAYVLPSLVPYLGWGETLEASFFVASGLRMLILMHVVFSHNSIAHKYGSKPYDKTMLAVDNDWLSYLTFGEGWHNFHHSFPWDYRSSEFWGSRSRYNPSTAFIDFFARIGWAYDLKTVSPKTIKDRAERTGDGSQYAQVEKRSCKSDENVSISTAFSINEHCWGWGDDSITQDQISSTKILRQL